MLNNITNFFNLIATKKVKTQLDATDLLAIGTKDPRFTGNYQPTLIKYSDLASQILAGPITVGVTSIASGTVGRLLFEGTGNVLGESANLFWDNTNGFLGIGTSTPNTKLHVVGSEYTFTATSGSINFYNTPGANSHFNFVNLRQDSDYIFKQNRGGAVNTTSLVLKGLTGNLLINTTTDAGYTFDVNGTARVSGILSLSSATGGVAYLQDTSASSAYNIFSLGNAGGNFAIVSRTSTGGYLADHYGIVQSSASSSYQRWFTSGVQRMQMSSTGNLLIGTTTDVASSKLTIESTTQGFLPPRMTSVQRTAIATPATGLMVYQTDGTEGLYIYKSTGWVLNS